jgi:hypothetical protein
MSIAVAGINREFPVWLPAHDRRGLPWRDYTVFSGYTKDFADTNSAPMLAPLNPIPPATNRLSFPRRRESIFFNHPNV